MTKDAFYSRWLDKFAVGISPREIKQYVKETGNYIWHIFSWELLEKNRYLVGEAAKRAYEEASKDGAEYIRWFREKKTHEITEDLLTAAALDEFTEVYVVGKDFKWTYIKTHESMCGPYFMMRKDAQR